MYPGSTTAFINKTVEEKKVLGQRDVKGDTRDYFILESWFASKRLDGTDMYVGADMVGMVKTNTKVLFKDNIENIKKDWPGVS